MSSYAMALFRDLCRTIAEVEGLSEMTVIGVGQYLRDAGLISKHGRGKAAAQMTREDAVNLIIGINATQLAKDAPSAVNSLRGPVKIDECYPITAEICDENGVFKALFQPSSAALCLDRLVDCFVSRSDKSAEFDEHTAPHISITFSRPLLRLSLRVEELSGSTEELPDLLALIEFESLTSVEQFDKFDRTTITEKTIAAVGRALSK